MSLVTRAQLAWPIFFAYKSNARQNAWIHHKGIFFNYYTPDTIDI